MLVERDRVTGAVHSAEDNKLATREVKPTVRTTLMWKGQDEPLARSSNKEPPPCTESTQIPALKLNEEAMIHDNDLQRSVLEELDWEPSVTAAHIGVTADEGVVSLSGYVDSFGQKHAAETATRRVKGVKAVVEGIEVRLPYDHLRNDDEIAKAALERLAWHVVDPDYKVAVKVEKGWITLTGQVAWFFQREETGSELRRLIGVVGLDNQITIKPKVNVANMSDDITHALHRSWFFDPNRVSVSAQEGRVKLTGTVHSLHEKQVAAVTAWSAPGVTAVENNLSVV